MWPFSKLKKFIETVDTSLEDRAHRSLGLSKDDHDRDRELAERLERKLREEFGAS